MNARQAAEGLSHLAKQYSAVLKAAEYLNALGDLESRIAEATKQTAVAVAEADTADQRLKALQKDVAQANANANALASNAKLEVARVLQKAAAQAMELTTTARAEAEHLVADAKAAADKIAQDAQAAAEAHSKQMEAWAQEEAEVRERLEKLRAEQADLRKRLLGVDN